MSALEDTPENRRVKYQAGWDNGDLVSILAAYTDSMTNKESNDTAAEFIRDKIRSIVRDPDTATALTPSGYPYGTKRPCLDSGYYATFNEPHVHLVDLRGTPLQEITENGLRTSEREYELYAIVFATGFDAMTGALTSIDIRGRGGVSLKEKWIDGPRTYLGLAVSGFPNLFTITGPASPSVLSNMVVSIEQHVEWISECIAHLRDVGKTEIAANQDAEDGWMTHNADAVSMTLYPSTDSWWNGANVLGKARVFMAYPGGVGSYGDKITDVSARDYEGFTTSV
jgi:cyclohexanone monooxygenase